MSACCYCGSANPEGGLRPYGPGGAPICFPCMKVTPEREATAKGAYGALLDAAEATSPVGVAAIGQESGPVPFDPARTQGEASR